MPNRRWLIGMFTIMLVGCRNVQASNITPSVIPLPTATPEPSVKPLPSVTPEPSIKPLPLATASPIAPTTVPLATATQIESPTIAAPTTELITTTTTSPSVEQLPLEACQQAVQTQATQYNISKFSPDLMRVTPVNPNTWEIVSTATVSFATPDSATFELLWLCEVSLHPDQQWSINRVHYTSQW